MTDIVVRFPGVRRADVVTVADIDTSNDDQVAAFRVALITTGFRLARRYQSELRRLARELGDSAREIGVIGRVTGTTIDFRVSGTFRDAVGREAQRRTLSRAAQTFRVAFEGARQTIQPSE